MVIRRTAQGGFTLLEMVVSMAYFVVLTYILTSAIQMGHGAHDAVIQGASENEGRRESREVLLSEFKAANSDDMVIEVQADGNDQVTMTQPILVEGNLTWGVSDHAISMDPEECTKEGWFVRYRVDAVEEDGAVNRRLVRQIIDADEAVHVEEVQAEWLCDGLAEPRGFGIAQAGDLWEVTLTFESETNDDRGRSSSFHVRTRN